MANPVPLYQEIARRLVAMENCRKSGNVEWLQNHGAAISHYVAEHFPHGSGFDGGVTFDFDDSTPDRLIFLTAFHHMNESGMYDGWTEHKLTVRPSLAFGYDLRIGGRDRDGIKEYIAECFAACLDSCDYTNPDASAADAA